MHNNVLGLYEFPEIKMEFLKNLKRIIGFLILILVFPVFAQTNVPALSSEQILPIPMISSERVRLDNKELHGVHLANEWKTHPDQPRYGEDGSVKYLFGATLPTLVCTPLQVCSIRLQTGESVNDVHVGDAVRWKITPATEGVDLTARTVVIVKPTDAGLVTNLIVTTDRRIYTIKLVSTQREWMPILSFDYPDEIQQEWAAYAQRQTQRTHANTLPSGQNIAYLDFNFRISGHNPSWKPIRVYTDGVKTYIQFPSSHFNEAPTLVTLGQSGSNEEIVNYRMIGDRYVVDKVLDKAILIIGVGRRQTRVQITYTGSR